MSFRNSAELQSQILISKTKDSTDFLLFQHHTLLRTMAALQQLGNELPYVTKKLHVFLYIYEVNLLL
jgi:hypothetical protein